MKKLASGVFVKVAAPVAVVTRAARVHTTNRNNRFYAFAPFAYYAVSIAGGDRRRCVCAVSRGLSREKNIKITCIPRRQTARDKSVRSAAAVVAVAVVATVDRANDNAEMEDGCWSGGDTGDMLNEPYGKIWDVPRALRAG